MSPKKYGPSLRHFNTIVGRNSDDSIIGTDWADRIFGRHGSDSLFGGIGSDRLFGGNGSDFLFGGIGHDYLEGGKGDDLLSGGDGGDTLVGGRGSDSLFGGAGRDFLYGDATNGGHGHGLETTDDYLNFRSLCLSTNKFFTTSTSVTSVSHSHASLTFKSLAHAADAVLQFLGTLCLGENVSGTLSLND